MEKGFGLFGVHLNPTTLNLVLDQLNTQKLNGKTIGLDITKEQLQSLKHIRIPDLANNLEFARDPHLNFAKVVADFVVRNGATIIPLVSSTRPGKYKKQELDRLEKSRTQKINLNGERRLFTPENLAKEKQIRDTAEYLKEQSILITTKNRKPDFVIVKATRTNLFRNLPHKILIDDRSLIERFLPGQVRAAEARRELLLARRAARDSFKRNKKFRHGRK